MATIYVMTKQAKHSYSEVLDGILNQQVYFLDYIKSNNFDEDDLMGLKLFLENNDYDVAALKKFISNEPLKAGAKKTNSNFKIYKIAALFILIMGVGYLIKLSTNKHQNLANYMVEDAGFKVWMGDNNNHIDLINGMSYYKNKNYSEALSYFSKTQNNDTAFYYSGISCMQLNKLNDAETFFSKVPNSSVYSNNSIFYISLCYLYNQQKEKGLQLLNKTLFDDAVLNEKRTAILKDFGNQ
jgi:tetratricopeptide (TPR) repeat protein